MEPFFPFIYQPEPKEEFEPLPLYIEEYYPTEPPKEEKEENNVIIINF